MAEGDELGVPCDEQVAAAGNGGPEHRENVRVGDARPFHLDGHDPFRVPSTNATSSSALRTGIRNFPMR